VRRRVTTPLIGLCVSFVAAGCVDGFRGSNIQIDLATATPAQASQGAVPRPDQLPANVHFTIYGIQTATDRERLFALDTFEIHPIVDVSSPCFIDVGENVRFPGLHVSQFAKMVGEDVGIPDYRNPPAGATEAQKIDAATAAQRMINIGLLGADTGIKAVTSASVRQYPAVDADCNGAGLPPAMCTDAAANARRLAKCQEPVGRHRPRARRAARRHDLRPRRWHEPDQPGADRRRAVLRRRGGGLDGRLRDLLPAR
jgi:hypothetical protein